MTDRLETLEDCIEHFDSAMLVTIAADGGIHARPMAVARAEDDADIWFVTDGHSGKVDELAKRPKCALTFQGGSRYVSLTGSAFVVRDRALIDELWQEAWKVWFPDGKNDSDLVLIKFVADQGEYWDLSGTNRLQYLLEAGKAYLKGERLEENDENINAKVGL